MVLIAPAFAKIGTKTPIMKLKPEHNKIPISIFSEKEENPKAIAFELRELNGPNGLWKDGTPSDDLSIVKKVEDPMILGPNEEKKIDFKVKDSLKREKEKYYMLLVKFNNFKEEQKQTKKSNLNLNLVPSIGVKIILS